MIYIMDLLTLTILYSVLFFIYKKMRDKKENQRIEIAYNIGKKNDYFLNLISLGFSQEEIVEEMKKYVK